MGLNKHYRREINVAPPINAPEKLAEDITPQKNEWLVMDISNRKDGHVKMMKRDKNGQLAVFSGQEQKKYYVKLAGRVLSMMMKIPTRPLLR